MKTLHTYKEIFQQPSCWLKEYEVLVAEKAKIQAFLTKYLTPETDIVLTGAGTSAFIGDAIAPVLRGAWKNVRAVATTDIVTSSSHWKTTGRAHTGESNPPTSLEQLHDALQNSTTTKVLHNGQVLIVREGVVYTLFGQQVK